MQTGISGNTLRKTCAPLTTFNLRFRAVSAATSCFADRRAGASRRIPYAPSCTVVPFVEPPVLKGMVILCALRYFVRRGARFPLCRTPPSCVGVKEELGVAVRRDGREDAAMWSARGVEIRDAEEIEEGPAEAEAAEAKLSLPNAAVSDDNMVGW